MNKNQRYLVAKLSEIKLYVLPRVSIRTGKI
jgi:hypothetical protein